MKILNAEVIDPRKRGDYRNPYLLVEVDEEIHATKDFKYHDDWRIEHHGPFLYVECRQPDAEWISAVGESMRASLAAFNTTRIIDRALVDVLVVTPEYEHDFWMDLGRARRLLRKHANAWKYVLDDVAGQHGGVLWRLTEEKPSCTVCGKPATGEAYYRGTHLNYCEQHMSEHSRKVRHLRVNS